MEAVVLAGGLGTRLRSVVPDLPKPMAPVAGRPFLEILLDRLAATGFERVVLSVGYRHEVIEAHFGPRHRHLELVYAVERQPLGTGGGLALALAEPRAAAASVFNGDTYLELDPAAMLQAHVAAGARLTLAAVAMADVSRYGALEIVEERVTGFAEKGRQGPGWINGGVSLLDPALVLDAGLTPPWSLETDLLMPRLAEIRPLAYRTQGRFIDIGIPEDYARAQNLLADL